MARKKVPLPTGKRGPRPKARPPMGGPKVIAQKSLDILAQGIREGLPPARAAALAGISHRTWDRYRQRGQAGDPIYREIEEVIRKAEAEDQERTLKAIKAYAHAKRDARTLLDRMGRRYPTEWGRGDLLPAQLQESQVALLFNLIAEECGVDAAEEIARRFAAAQGSSAVPTAADHPEG